MPDDDEIRDLAAEPDEPPDEDATATVVDGDDASPLYTGLCRGGPWGGLPAESRFPAGFLLVDAVGRRVWIYDRREDGDFYVRSEEPAPLLDEGDDNRWRAADESSFDIRSVDYPEPVEPEVLL